jgi:hypothetical protein
MCLQLALAYRRAFFGGEPARCILLACHSTRLQISLSYMRRFCQLRAMAGNLRLAASPQSDTWDTAVSPKVTRLPLKAAEIRHKCGSLAF